MDEDLVVLKKIGLCIKHKISTPIWVYCNSSSSKTLILHILHTLKSNFSYITCESQLKNQKNVNLIVMDDFYAFTTKELDFLFNNHVPLIILSHGLTIDDRFSTYNLKCSYNTRSENLDTYITYIKDYINSLGSDLSSSNPQPLISSYWKKTNHRRKT